jgi:hypothetical protein
VTFPEGFKDHSNFLKSILAAMKKKHQAIAGSLCSGVGIKLQFIDSQIIERVIEQFTKRKIPVLTVHDSCIIASKYAEELRGRTHKQDSLLGSDVIQALRHREQGFERVLVERWAV